MTINDAYRHSWSRNLAQDFLDTFDASLSKDNYFFFIGKSDSWGVGDTPVDAVDSRSDATKMWSDTIALKRLDSRNAMLVVPRFDWTSGASYIQWDSGVDHNKDGFEDAYYVIADKSRVYKCIKSGGSSTIKPIHTIVDIVEYSDGYRWKFLYELTERMKEFLTNEYMPVSFARERLNDETLNQSITQSQSVNGSIDYVKVVSTGDETFNKSTTIPYAIRKPETAGSNTVDLDISASSINGDYVGYAFYIVSGRGEEIGTMSRITAYDGPNRRVTLLNPLPTDLFIQEGTSNSSKYQILPHAVISGDGTGCDIVANVNAANQVSSIVVINPGKDYNNGSVRITTNNNSGSIPAVLTPILAPAGGHGSNAPNELVASRVMILIHSNIDKVTGTWPAENDFRQFGIVKNPILNQVGITYDTIQAGNEYDRTTEISILKPYGVDANYTYDDLSGTYKVGNFVIGNDSLAIGQVRKWEPHNDGSFSILTVNNIQGSFRTSEPNKNEYRFAFGDTGGGNFVVGETVQQYITGTPTGTTSQGIVESWATGDAFNELVVLGNTGSFVSTPGATVSNVGGAVLYSNILGLQPKGGELIKQYEDLGGLSGSSFVGIDNDQKQKYGRVISQSATTLDTINRPSYRMTDVFRVSKSTPYTASNYAPGGITYTDPSTLQISNANIFAHNMISSDINGATVDLYVHSVVGNFPTGATISIPSFDVSLIDKTDKEVVIGSGEIVYIQNIRPVARSREQEEEFKVLLGF